MIANVDQYLIAGCMRCELGNTPACKVHNWQPELQALRALAQQTELTEEIKWGVPCYTLNGSNVILIGAFKEYVALSFFKGSLLPDPEGMLQKPGENTQVARLLRFTKLQQITDNAQSIHIFIQHAIDAEKQGLKPVAEKKPDPIPDELQQTFEALPQFAAAFHALTPGRQRAYILYFSAPKQSKTRSARIQKYRQQIMDGIGLNDKYSG